MSFFCPEDIKMRSLVVSELEDCQSSARGSGCALLKEGKCQHPLFNKVNCEEVKAKIEELKKVAFKTAPNKHNDPHFNTLNIELIKPLEWLGVKE